MKVKLVQFYRDKIQPKIAALKAKAGQLKQRVGEWLAQHRRRVWQVAAVVATLVAVVVVAILWPRLPGLRAAGKGLATAVTGLLAGLWTLLRGRRSTEIPVPVVVTEQPPVEAAFPVEPGPADGEWIPNPNP